MSEERKCISLDEALILLSTCAAVVVDTEAVMFTNYPDKEELFLSLSWCDEDNLDHIHNFKTEDNKNINISGPFMYLLDENKEEFELHLLTSMNLEDKIHEMG